MTTMPTSRGFLEDLARALHTGRTWQQIAAALGADTTREVREFYRPRVASYILRRLPDSDPAHGTLARYELGGCYPDGRRCDPCQATKVVDQRIRRAEDRGEVELPTDPAAVMAVADRLHAGASWADLAAAAGRTVGFYRDAYRELVQPRCLELVNRDDPPGPGGRQHGTRARYTHDGCDCEPCTYACVLYERDRGRKHRKGLRPYVDADPVRDHVRALMAAGVGSKRIAQLAGVSSGAMTRLLWGHGGAPSARVRPATARRLLSVKVDDRADGSRVPAADTHAYVALLVEAGWTKRAISKAIGQDGIRLQLGAEYVTVRNARAVRDLYRAHLDRGGDR